MDAGEDSMILIREPDFWIGEPTPLICASWLAVQMVQCPSKWEPQDVKGDNVIHGRYGNGVDIVLRKDWLDGFGNLSGAFRRKRRLDRNR